jgi:hypothetical protein
MGAGEGPARTRSYRSASEVIYVYDRTIQSYIDEERQRVVALARKVSGALLIFCIDNGYSVAELTIARKRFEETRTVVDAEDLM